MCHKCAGMGLVPFSLSKRSCMGFVEVPRGYLDSELCMKSKVSIFEPSWNCMQFLAENLGHT